MKKVSILLILIILSLLLSGCQNGSQHSTEEADELPIIQTAETYGFEVIRNQNIKKPSGIVVTDNNILIADAEKHCIHVLDLDGNYVSSIGSIGMENGSFFRPGGLAWQNNKLYVVDSKNCRIQVFDETLSFIKSYSLTKIDSDYPYNYIAVTSEGDIYVTSTSALSQYAHIYHIHAKDGRQSLIGNNILGTVSCADNDILFADSYEIFNNGGLYSTTGHNSLYSIDDEEMNLIAELPYKYSPIFLLYKDASIYAFSFRGSTLDKLDMQGNYIETLVQIPVENQTYSFYAMAYNKKDNSFLLTFPDQGYMMRVYETNDKDKE